MRHRKWAPLLALMAGMLVTWQASAAVTSNFPSAKFNDEDRRMQGEAQDAVLASDEVGTTRSWANPATGNAGKIELLRNFQASDGRECKRLRITSQAGQAKGVTTMNACRDPGGKWRMDSTAHQ
jgi:surface antigen